MVVESAASGTSGDQSAASMAPILPTYAPRALTLVKGEGVRVWDDGGNAYYDLTGGIAVNILGHAHPVIREALAEQSARLVHCSNLFYNRPACELAEALVERIGPGGVFFCNSGAEANETVFKLARKYGHASGRHEIITAVNSFHGRTFAGISATGQDKVKSGFEPLLPGFTHVPYNDFEAIRNATTGKTIAVHLEGIQGEGGVYPADPDMLLALRKWTRENDILLLWDGVQCGYYRTGDFQSYRTLLKGRPGADAFVPDAIAMAKALGGGVPIGAAWVAEPYREVLGPGSHGCTFGGNPLSAAVALAVLREIESRGYPERIRGIGDHIMARLNGMKSGGRITEVRGAGALIGMTIEGELNEARARLMQKGLLLAPAARNTLRLLPPINITPEEADACLDIIESCLG